MKLIFMVMTSIILCSHIASESLNMFITKIKVADKNSNNKDWDTFKGAPDIQITVSKKQNEKWEKCYTSEVYTNHYSVEEQIMVNATFELGDEIMVEVVDRDFRNNDAIGSQIFSLNDGDIEDTTSFSMVESFSYIITRYSSIEERNKAIENAKWLELEKKKKLEQEKKNQEKENWQEQKEAEKHKLQQEINKTKETIMSEFFSQMEAQKKQAEAEIEARKKQTEVEIAAKKQKAEMEIAVKKEQVEVEIAAKKQKVNAEIKAESEKAALERLAAKQMEAKEIETLAAKRKKLAADLEYESSQNQKQLQEWEKTFEDTKKEEQAKLNAWKNQQKESAAKELTTWEKLQKQTITEKLMASEKQQKQTLAEELTTWEKQQKQTIADQLTTWEKQQKQTRTEELTTWEKQQKQTIAEQLTTWEKQQKQTIADQLTTWEKQQREKILAQLQKDQTPKEKPVLFKGSKPKKMTPEEIGRAIRALELTLRHMEPSSSIRPERMLEEIYENFTEGIIQFSKGYKQLERMAKKK